MKNQEKLRNLAALAGGILMRHDDNELPTEKYRRGKRWEVRH